MRLATSRHPIHGCRYRRGATMHQTCTMHQRRMTHQMRTAHQTRTMHHVCITQHWQQKSHSLKVYGRVASSQQHVTLGLLLNVSAAPKGTQTQNPALLLNTINCQKKLKLDFLCVKNKNSFDRTLLQEHKFTPRSGP